MTSPTLRRPATLFTALLLLALVAAPSALASFPGTPGKVAWIARANVADPKPPYELLIDDPWDVGVAPKVVTTVEPAPDGDTPRIGFMSSPAWSPDGTEVAFAKFVPDPGNGGWHTAIFIAKHDGTGVRQLTTPREFRPDTCEPSCSNVGVWADHSPTWSPDGTKIAFIRIAGIGEEAGDYGERGHDIFVTTPAGGAPQRLTSVTDTGIHNGLAWSPDGTQLATTWVPEKAQPYLAAISAAGGGRSKLAQVTGSPMDFDWAPDGKSIALSYVTPGGFKAGIAENGVTRDIATISGTHVRFSNDGNGLIHDGCATLRGRYRCGLLQHTIPDPDADIRPNDPPNKVIADLPSGKPFNTVTGGFGRSLVDVQPQELPIVFLPGFLGSEIQCDGELEWPTSMPMFRVDTAKLALAEDGKTNAGCATAGATGKMIDTALGTSVYDTTRAWINAVAPGRSYFFGWDWRKAPTESIAGLQAVIDDALDDPRMIAQGVKRVTLYGHSYGGLLARLYIDDPTRARRVQRVLTAGTPFWGSPKPAFPLAFGQESPLDSNMDALFDNTGLQELTRNLAGGYQLWPSANMPDWLNVDGQELRGAAIGSFVASLGGNSILWGQAQQRHVDVYDGFFDDDGRIDVRAVRGVGVPTVGHIAITNTGPGEADVTVRMTDGDKTVPAISAGQGPVPTDAPLGDPAHVQEVCGVEHVPLPGAQEVAVAYADFVDRGVIPRKTADRPCPMTGTMLQTVTGVEVPATDRAATRGAATGTARRAAGGGPLGFGDAERQGLADVFTLGRSTFAVTTPYTPVDLAFTGTDAVFDVTLFDGDRPARVLRYGPATGSFVLEQRDTGAPVVTLDGATLEPSSVTPAPGGGAPASPASGAGPGAGAPQPAGGSGRPAGGTRRCVVPRLKGLSVATARVRLRRAGCRAGRVTKARGARGRLVVRSSVPKAGARVSATAAVRLVLGAKPRGRR